MKWTRRATGISIVLLAIPAAWFLSGLAGRSREVQPTPLPVILQQVQSLGELHTTRYAYNNVFEYQTSLEPAAWVDRIGMGSLVRDTTRNHTLVSAHGTVEAGVDLSRASARYEGAPSSPTLVVTLPKPTVYRPHVDATLHQTRPGFFWRDDNLGLKAQRDADARFTRASREQGIVASAQESAVERVTAFLDGIVETPVRVEFDGG